MPVAKQVLVHIAGSRWENTRGTDHRIAAAMAESVHVLWVDPPLSRFSGASGSSQSKVRVPYTLDSIAPGITRLRTVGPPGFTKPLIRSIANGLLGRAIKSALKRLDADAMLVMVSSPIASFPKGISGPHLLYVTDDWEAGSGFMGLSNSAVRRQLLRNIASASIAAAVSPQLAERVAQMGGMDVHTVPNGCTVSNSAAPLSRRSVAGLVGQLNERLDFDTLDAVISSGIRIEVIGPRRERSDEAAARLDRFLSAENVTWLGELPESDLKAHLETYGVGLTPYTDSDFNRASFPLKTLEYLAAGISVVSTDLPATRWLECQEVSIASDTADFVAKVRAALRAGTGPQEEAARRKFAGQHSWAARAEQLFCLAGVKIS